MDRLPRQWIAACALGLIAIGPGCRSTRPEVPPGRRFDSDGRQKKAIEFSSDGHPMSAAATTNIMPDTARGGSKLAQGIDAGGRPDGMAYSGVPAGYGPPGSAGRADDPGLGRPPRLDGPAVDDPAAMPASMQAPLAPASVPPTMPPPSDLAPMPDPVPSPAPGPSAATSASPASDNTPAPNPIIQTGPTAGRMGSSDQMPGPT